MVTASAEEIAEWNRAVDERNAARKRPSGKFNFNVKGTGQHPKLPKDRAHKQHKHPLRDDHGAYTLVGKARQTMEYVEGVAVGYAMTERRMWLAGISAQRGY
jgi:hypothetical protein